MSRLTLPISGETINNSHFILKKTDNVLVNDNAFGDILDKWAIAEFSGFSNVSGNGEGNCFVKHCRFRNPVKNRYMFVQVFVSTIRSARILEGVFEANAHMSDWISMEPSAKHGMLVPSINLCDGNFPPTEIEYRGYKGAFSWRSVKDSQTLYEMMIHFGLVTEKELLFLRNMSKETEQRIMPIVMG